MYSSKRVHELFVIFLAVETLLCDVHEPRCYSRFDFEEKMLDMMVRNEIKMEEVVGKLDVLEKRLTNVETKVDNSVNEIHGLEKKQGAAIYNSVNSIQGLEKSCGSLQTELDTFENTTQSNFVRLEKSVEEYSERLDALLKKNTEGMHQDSVAFFATLSSGFTTSSSQTIIFNKVVTDVSGVYNPGTGVFTAPTDGLYVFSATVMVNLSTSTAHTTFRIFKNGSIVVYFQVNDKDGSTETSAGTILLSLQVADTVYVTCGGSGRYIHGSYTFFSGFRL